MITFTTSTTTTTTTTITTTTTTIIIIIIIIVIIILVIIYNNYIIIIIINIVDFIFVFMNHFLNYTFSLNWTIIALWQLSIRKESSLSVFFIELSRFLALMVASEKVKNNHFVVIIIIVLRFSLALISWWVFYITSQLPPAAQRCSTFLRICAVPTKAGL